MAGKNNTTRIEELEELANNLTARLDLYDFQLKGIAEVLEKGTATTQGHTSKIIVFEEKLLILVDVKKCIETVAAIQQDLVGIKKDIQGLAEWKAEAKKERDEAARRLWAFGPNLLGAMIGGLITLAIALLVYWLNKPK